MVSWETWRSGSLGNTRLRVPAISWGDHFHSNRVSTTRRARGQASPLAAHLCRVRGVQQFGQRVALELPADGGRRAPQHAGHGPHAGTLLSHACHRHPILGLELLVLRLFLHVHTLRDEVLHFTFEAAVSKVTVRIASNDAGYV